MQTKNTLKFIIILAAVGFFGSILVSGPSQLPAPLALSAQVGAANTPGKSLMYPIVFETAADARFEFRLAPGADSNQYQIQEINPTNGSAIGQPRVFPRQPASFRIPPGDLNKLLPGRLYSLKGSSCSASQCFNTYSAAFFFMVRTGAVPAQQPAVAPSVPPASYTFFTMTTEGDVYSWDRTRFQWQLALRQAPEPAPVVEPVVEVAQPRGFFGPVSDFFTGIQKFAENVFISIANVFNRLIGKVPVSPSDTIPVPVRTDMGIDGASKQGTVTPSTDCQYDILTKKLVIIGPTASNTTSTSANLSGTVQVTSPIPGTYLAELVYFGISSQTSASILASGIIPTPGPNPLTMSGTAGPLSPGGYGARIQVTKTSSLGAAPSRCFGPTIGFKI